MKNIAKKTTNYIQSKFKKGLITCPICGKSHRYYCSITEDEGMVLCSFVPSEREAIDGRYIHILKKSKAAGFPKF